jgi:hypothetical protein
VKDKKTLEEAYLSVNNTENSPEGETLNENVEVGTMETPALDGIETGGPGEGIETPAERDDETSMKSKEKKKADNKTVKTVKEDINNSRTMKHNIFDKLYSTIMENDDELPSEFPGEELELGDEGDLEASEADEVTVTLSKDLAQELYDLLGKHLEDGGSDEPEEVGFEDELELAGNDPYDDEVVEDAIKVEPAPKELGDSNLKDNKNNKVAASGYSGTGSTASHKGDVKTQADPSELPDSNLKNKKDNKVRTSAGVGKQIGS